LELSAAVFLPIIFALFSPFDASRWPILQRKLGRASSSEKIASTRSRSALRRAPMEILPFTRAATEAHHASAARDDGLGRLDLLPVDGGWSPVAIIPGPVLGNGRAAEARLVEALGAGGRESILVVEKTFRPGMLTRLIYRAAYQAPFAYQHTRDAILACFYRRRVAAAIVSAKVPGVRVAQALYVRHDRQADAWVLGTEFVRGRGIRPAPADRRMLRNWFRRIVWGDSAAPRSPEEIDELLDVMTALEQLFRSSGLIGTGWQVCSRALVSTANLLRTDDGYALVDLESGMPAVAVARYVLDGLRMGSPPLFDDVDGPRLTRWLDVHRTLLTARLGADQFQSLRGDAARLIHHTRRWKKSEPALLRNRTAVAGRRFRRRYGERLVDTWLRRRIIDRQAAQQLQPPASAVRSVTFALGLAPGRVGRFLQRCWANKPYRAEVARFLRDARYCRAVLHSTARRCAARWRESKRTSPDLRLSRPSFRFIVHLLLSCVSPPGVHRWLTDAAYRQNSFARAYLLIVSARFQSEYARHVVGEMIRRWRRQGRVESDEAEILLNQLEDQELDEYVRCFGMHLGLKFLLLVLAPLKIGGLTATLATGNPLYLLPIFIMPACRTAITLWRMAGPSRRHIRYVEALAIGPLPVLGFLAYAVQMWVSHPQLSELLLRDAASRIGRVVPIWGGKDSRVEIWAIKAVNLLLEGMDVLRVITRPLERLLSRAPARRREAVEPATIRFRRSARLEARQIALLIASESPEESEVEAAFVDRPIPNQLRLAG
jgi:hypothetical protein